MNCNTCNRAVIDTLTCQEPDTSRHAELFEEVRRRTEDAPDLPAPTQCLGPECERPARMAEVTEVVVRLSLRDDR